MPHTTKHPDPYPFHRIALAPLLPGATHADMERSCTKAIELGETAFAEFLCCQGLAPLWDERIEQYPGQLPLSAEFSDLMHQARMHATGIYLIQHHSLVRVRETLEETGVAHAVIKGAHTREVYYHTPALRPAADIDVLVRPDDKLRAIKAFQTQGFEFYGVAENISHEASLVKGNTSVDLHWDILRPGRTRIPMAPTILGARKDYGSHWGLDEDATLFMLLVHPVFTKYLTAPQATLVRQLDLAYLLHKVNPSWPRIVGWLARSGLKTAGWLSLRWLEILTGSAVLPAVTEDLNPRSLRRWYLQKWLEQDLASRWADKPTRVQLGLTLPAHDRFSDALHALQIARKCRRTGPQILKALKTELPQTTGTRNL